MKRFRVALIDPAGQLAERIISAPDAAAVARRLGDEGSVLQAVTVLRPCRRLSIEAQVAFCQHLPLMLGAGLPLVDAVESLVEDGGDRSLSRLCRELAGAMRGGSALADALAAAGDPLDPFALAMVRTGEATGRLDESLNAAAEHLQWGAALRRSLWRGLSYPLLILVILIAAIPVLFIWLVPQLLAFLAFSGGELPWYTHALIATADAVAGGWPQWLAAAGVGASALWALWRWPSGRRMLQRGLLRTPALGPLLHTARLARIARELGLIYRAGIPLEQALSMLAGHLPAGVWRGVAARAQQALDRGEPLHAALADPLVPALLRQLIRIGELSGTLDHTLGRAAELYSARAASRADALVALAGPLMLLFAGGLIIWLVAALILPLYDGLFALGAV